MKIILAALFWLLIASITGDGFAQTCTHYAAPSGTGDGSTQAKPFRIGDFWAVAKPGSTLCLVASATSYTLSNSAGTDNAVLNAEGHSGTVGNPITIKCLTDGGCDIDGQGVNQPVWTASSNYITLEDFNAHSSHVSVIGMQGGTGLIIRRVVAWDAGQGNTVSGQRDVFFPYLAQNILLEDVASFGNGGGQLQLFGGWPNTKGTVRRYWGMYSGSQEENAPDEVVHMGYDAGPTIVENAIVTWDKNIPSESKTLDRALIIMGVSGYELKLLGSIGYVTDAASYLQYGIREWFSSAEYDRAPYSGLVENVAMYMVGANHVQPYNMLAQAPCGSPGMPVCYFRNNTEIGGASSTYEGSFTLQNNVDVASITALNTANANIWNGASTNGARVCYRYVDGVLQNGQGGTAVQPLWPWPMDARIRAALTKSGRNPDTIFGGTGNSVTQQMALIFGTIPPACTGAGGPVAPTVTITAPTSATTYSTNQTTINMGGTLTVGSP